MLFTVIILLWFAMVKLWFTVVGPDGAHQALESLYWHRTKGYGLANEAQCKKM